MAPPPVPIQGMNDMASQQRALQSYMDSMFASVPLSANSQAAGVPVQGNINNMMQHNFSGTQASLASTLPGQQDQQQQQQQFHPGVSAIFQSGGAPNAPPKQAYPQMMPFAAQQSMPPPPQPQQSLQSSQANNTAWNVHQPQHNASATSGGGQRQLFNPQQQQTQQSPQIPQTQLQNSIQQYSQAELQAMLASLGQPNQPQQQYQPQNFGQSLPSQHQQRPAHLQTFPQAPAITQQNQQPNQQQPQTVQPQSQGPPLPTQSSNTNSQYPPHLQAAFQQLQAAHASHSTPPPGAIQALAAFQQQQHQQASAAVAAHQVQQTAAAQHLQQQVQQAQAQFQAQQASGSAQGLSTPGATPDISLLLKLRQQGVQLSADQQMLLSRTMPRRGAVTGDGTPSQAFNNISLPSQSSNHQASQQIPQQGQQNTYHSPQIGDQTQLLQQSQQQASQQPRLQQQQQQHQVATQQSAHTANALSLDIANMQPPNVQDQQGRPPNSDGSIPLSVLQEFTQMNDHLRQMTQQEGHLQSCLAQNLYLPYNKPGQPLQGGNQPTPQPLTPQHREHFQKQMEQLRSIHSRVRESLARIEETWGGKDNIISSLRNVAFQRQMQTGNNSNSTHTTSSMHSEVAPLQQPSRPGQHQQMPLQPNQQGVQMPHQGSHPSQQQTHQLQQQPSQPQQPQQQSQEAAQLQKLLDRQQMRTPVNAFQQQALPQSTPPQGQAPSLPQLPPQQTQQPAGPPHMQQQPQQVQQQGYPVPQNAAAAQAQAQLQRVVQMQQNQLANGPNGSPGSNLRALPSMMPQLSPSLDKSSLQTQQQQGQRQQTDGQHAHNHSQHQQLLRMQAAAVNEEILKTLTNAGPQTFMKALIDTMKHRGTPLTTFPRVDGKEVDLFRLYRVVQQRGGSALIRQQGLWRQVALETGIPVSAESSQRVFDQMSKVYGDFLEAFEDTQRRAAFATVSKHSLSQMPLPLAGMPSLKTEQQPSTQQQISQQLPAKQPQPQLQQPQSQPQQQQQLLQQQPPQQINMQNQQFQQQQYLQSMQQIQAQAQAALQHPDTPQQQGQQQLANQQSVRQNQQVRDTQSKIATQNNEAPVRQESQQQNQNQNRQISPPSVQQNPQNLQNRLPNLPPPADVTKARADIEAWKATLSQSKLKCTRLEDFNPADIEPFIHLSTSLSPMVDRIIELLPLYLAISKQQQGAHTLLVMLFMFREQLALLDRREFILRINDLEKLKMQMQRCWSFVSAFTSGTATNSQPIPNTEIPANVTNVPAPATTDSAPQQKSQIGAGTPDFVGATMKAGLTVQDLKPPPAKKRRTESPADTPPNLGAAQPQTKSIGNAADQSSAPGTGTYASPIALDSPPAPASKASLVLEGQGQPMAAKATKGQKKSAPANKSVTQPSVPASPNKPIKAKAKKTAPQQAVAEDIAVPEIPLAITPAAIPLTHQQDAQILSQQQEETHKRKRELQEAQEDPAAFTEHMLSSLLGSSNNNVKQQIPSQPAAGGMLTSEILAFLTDQGLSVPSPATFGQPAHPSGANEAKQRAKPYSGSLKLIFDEMESGVPSQLPTVGRWFHDTPSVAAETPELSQSEDPNKTSPADPDWVVTPSDSLQTARVGYTTAAVQHGTTPSTASILSSFDQEYQELFKAVSGSSVPSQIEGGSPADMAWSWDSGPVKVA